MALRLKKIDPRDGFDCSLGTKSPFPAENGKKGDLQSNIKD